MVRIRKRAKQLSLDLRKRGGKRRGAGRPCLKGERRHEKRPAINGREPLHVTIKLGKGLPSLRQKTIWKAFKRAAERSRLKGLRLIHFALLSNHAHLLIEAESNEVLTSGLKSLVITLAKALNKLATKKGRAFKDRYHLHVLKTPAEVRRVLSYIFANEAKHRQSRIVQMNAFSSMALVHARTLPTLLMGYAVQAPAPSQISALRVLMRELCLTPTSWLLRTAIAW